jgi:5'-AMP-activated protein kinase catalytic alpha subunit
MLIETSRLGFDRDLLVDSIRNRMQNKATVTYYLLCDNRRKLPSSGYLRCGLGEISHVWTGKWVL